METRNGHHRGDVCRTMNEKYYSVASCPAKTARGSLFLIVEMVMIKHIHMLLVLVSFAGFASRVILAEIHPHAFKQKWIRILPHIVDTLLLISGVALVFIGNWLSSDYGWIIAKFIALLVYIGLGVLAIRSHGKIRWLAFTGAVLSFLYIARVAVSKQIVFFL